MRRPRYDRAVTAKIRNAAAPSPAHAKLMKEIAGQSGAVPASIASDNSASTPAKESRPARLCSEKYVARNERGT